MISRPSLVLVYRKLIIPWWRQLRSILSYSYYRPIRSRYCHVAILSKILTSSASVKYFAKEQASLGVMCRFMRDAIQ